MHTHELQTMRDLCDNIITLRQLEAQSANSIKEKREDLDRYVTLCENLTNEKNAIQRAKENALNANEDLKKQCSDLMLERDNLRLKLGEWARFINFNIYERMNKFVAKGKTAKEKCDSLTAFFEQICRSLEAFQKMHQITLIEGGMAK